MESRAWLEGSLQRSGSLGREVLERASRRSVDRTNPGDARTPTTAGEHAEFPVKRTHTELDDVFANITHFMAQTTCQCERFYESGCCAEPTETERIHVSRFHTRPAARKTTPASAARRHAKAPHSKVKARVAAAGEDFFIEVSPGTYAVTASMPESQQQTRLVSVKDGESIDLTFNL